MFSKLKFFETSCKYSNKYCISFIFIVISIQPFMIQATKNHKYIILIKLYKLFQIMELWTNITLFLYLH